MRLLFVLFILVPLLEMVLLIKVGGVIGALPTILLVCLTAAVGVALIRAHGFSVLRRAQQKLAAGTVPAQELLDGLSLIVGGAMLLTPGFFTDAIGFTLLIPAIRKAIFHGLIAKMLSGRTVVQGFGPAGHGQSQHSDNGQVIQGEYSRDDENRS